jgi:hypothetical protein
MRLIQTSDMTLLSRFEIQGKILKEIGKGRFMCAEQRYLEKTPGEENQTEEDREEEAQAREDPEDPCGCRRRLKKELNYSILSHRWDADELTFSDFVAYRQLLAGSGNKFDTPSKKLFH